MSAAHAIATDWLSQWLSSGRRFVSDSRAVRVGDVFVAYPGTTGDGRNYIDQAVANGACGVVVEARGYVARHCAVPVVALENLRRRYPALADEASGFPSRALTLIGVTGTNGKTSLSTWIAQALEAMGVGCGLIGTVGAGRIGALVDTRNTTPDAGEIVAHLQQFVTQGARAAAMEVSSHALDQERVHGLHFRYAVFTNLTHDHLDYHGTMEAYAQAKAQLFAMPSLVGAVLNADDPTSARMRKATHATVVSYGFGEADVRATDCRFDRAGLQLTACTPWGEVRVRPPVLGRFNAANVLALIATLGAMGHSPADIVKGVNAITPVRGRMQRIAAPSSSKEAPLVLVDYAHTPDALEKALRTVRDLAPQGRVFVVFGCGGNRDAKKRPLMGRIAQQLADYVFVTNDNPRAEEPLAIAQDILQGISDRARVQVELDRARAIRAAMAQAGEHDVVLIAGKGHETYQEVMGVRHPFDDASVAREALCSR